MWIRHVYASTAQSGVGLNEYKRILSQAQANKHRRNLTGMLAFNSKIFLQALEGSRDQIDDLYARLLGDTRHNTVTRLNYREIEERHWANWSMGFAASNTDNRALFLKYSQQSAFNAGQHLAPAVDDHSNRLIDATQAGRADVMVAVYKHRQQLGALGGQVVRYGHGALGQRLRHERRVLTPHAHIGPICLAKEHTRNGPA